MVAGNSLIFMGKNGLKNYPLNRYVVERDGDGNIIEIVIKESVAKTTVKGKIPVRKPNSVSAGGGLDGAYTGEQSDDVEIYTHVEFKDNKWVWYQECEGSVLSDSRSTAPKDASPMACP